MARPIGRPCYPAIVGPRFLRAVSLGVALVLSSTTAAAMVCAATCRPGPHAAASTDAAGGHAPHQAIVRAPSCHGEPAATVGAGDTCCAGRQAAAGIEAGVVTRPWTAQGILALAASPSLDAVPARAGLRIEQPPMTGPPAPSRASFSVLRI
jgi:hypothetical protein